MDTFSQYAHQLSVHSHLQRQIAIADADAASVSE